MHVGQPVGCEGSQHHLQAVDGAKRASSGAPAPGKPPPAASTGQATFSSCPCWDEGKPSHLLALKEKPGDGNPGGCHPWSAVLEHSGARRELQEMLRSHQSKSAHSSLRSYG